MPCLPSSTIPMWGSQRREWLEGLSGPPVEGCRQISVLSKLILVMVGGVKLSLTAVHGTLLPSFPFQVGLLHVLLKVPVLLLSTLLSPENHCSGPLVISHKLGSEAALLKFHLFLLFLSSLQSILDHNSPIIQSIVSANLLQVRSATC